MDGQHRKHVMPQQIPQGAATWTIWPAPEGWPDIRGMRDAELAADSFVAGHARGTGHKCYVGVSYEVPNMVIAVCEDCKPGPE